MIKATLQWINEELLKRKPKGDKQMKQENTDKTMSETKQEQTNVVVLNEEELKFVPEKEKSMYMELKLHRPEIAQAMLEDYKQKKEPEPEKEVSLAQYLINQNDTIIAKLDQLLLKK